MTNRSLREHMRRISKKGVAARQAAKAKQLVPRAIWPPSLKGRAPETIQDWLLLGAAASKAIWEGALDPRIAKEISSLVRASLAAFKVASLEKKLAQAEEIVSTIEARGSAKQHARILELERQLEVARAQARNPLEDLRNRKT